jgi:hypothetical protein
MSEATHGKRRWTAVCGPTYGLRPANEVLRFLSARAHTRRAPTVMHFACTIRIFGDKAVRRLLVLAIEEVIGSVRHKRLIANVGGGEATVIGGRSSLGV